VQNEDTLVFNNAAYLIADRGGTPIPASDRVSHNVILPRSLQGVFTDASQEALTNGTFDLRPAPGSLLIDAGRIEPDITKDQHGNPPDVGAYEAGGKRWVAGADWQDEPLGIKFVVRLELPRKHHSIRLPTRLYESGISAKGLRALQKLYDELWAENDRAATRQKAILLRERYPENTPERKQHHAIVAKLHREVWLLLRDCGSKVLSSEDRSAFERMMGIKRPTC
jgi:hypothetical protein